MCATVTKNMPEVEALDIYHDLPDEDRAIQREIFLTLVPLSREDRRVFAEIARAYAAELLEARRPKLRLV